MQTRIFSKKVHNEASLTQTHKLIAKSKTRFKIGGEIFLSEDKKKMYYYYGGKEKKASEIKKGTQEMAPYAVQQDFDRMMDRFEREFADFWAMPPRWKQWMHERPFSDDAV